ncbi:MAG: 2Fe-2S iron-sulfur cluster binding domain-containing protein [Comamonadaceae bacterium]|nr:MAG: 2Fe-2S iron-sulfur cluster binding domain-containing protein [Comamonadaceae bacterium]
MDSGDCSQAWRARIAPHGPDFPAPRDIPLLTAAELAGLVLESSCRNGTCRTCICTLQEGRVNYRIEWPGLSAEEKAEGLILPCVAYPSSDVTIRFPYRLPEWAE